MLTLWRARLRNSSAPERVFNAVRAVVAETGVLSGRNRRVLDSTVLDDAVATQDTVTMITAQIRRCRRLIAQARETVVSHNYEQPGRPSCDWGDPQSRSGLINGLVADEGWGVLKSVAGAVLDPEQTDAVGLLAMVVGQDTEPDPRPGGEMADRPPGGSRIGPSRWSTPKLGTPAKLGRSVGTVTKRTSPPNPTPGSSPPVTFTSANTPDGAIGVKMLEDED